MADYIEELEDALIDVIGDYDYDGTRGLDPEFWQLSDGRAEEINNLMRRVIKNYNQRHGIKE